MFIAAQIFLALATIAVLSLFFLPEKQPVGTASPSSAPEVRRGQKLPWDENADWEDIKAAWIAEFSTSEENKTPQYVAASSWGRTFALCAVLCILGVLLETQFNRRISLAEILSCFGSHSVASAPSRSR